MIEDGSKITRGRSEKGFTPKPLLDAIDMFGRASARFFESYFKAVLHSLI